MSELVNLCLFFLAIAKVCFLCGFVPAIAFLFFSDRIREIGFEQVSGDGQLATASKRQSIVGRERSDQSEVAAIGWATSPSRKNRRFA